MTEIVALPEIRRILDRTSLTSLIDSIEQGFVLYSKKKVVVPPVGHLEFKRPPGDLHIKYGYIEDDDYYVIKVASGFYENSALGINSSNGMMLVFSQKTGEALAILLDEGFLTDIRTAVAGAIAAKYLAPAEIKCIGIVGTGIQARLQLQWLHPVRQCREVIVWGRSADKLELFKMDPTLKDYSITLTTDIRYLTSRCNLIVTTTPAKNALIAADDVLPGTHITAVGADAPGKQEIDPKLFAKADVVVADSRQQCIDHGDISYAVREKKLVTSKIIELGDAIENKLLRRVNDQQISIADLTGVAIQDIQISKYVYLMHMKKK